MTASDDHDPLPQHAEVLLHRLETIRGRMMPGETTHMQHLDHAQRAHQLADHLRAALLLGDAHHYASALVVIRSALEHHLMDRLILLANRYIVTYTKARRKDADRWETDIRAMQTEGSDIDGWFWDQAGLNVVHRGLHSARSRKGRGMTISAWYFEADRFDPFVGPRKHASRLARPFWEQRWAQEQADEQAVRWQRLFKHDAVMKALRVNHLLAGLTIQVDVHYSFLSGFAHPSKRGYEAVYGRGIPDRMGRFDHYASELVLLYVIALAGAELELFGRMARRAPRLELAEWEAVKAEVEAARAASSHFWFLSGGPTELDRIETIHTPRGDTRPRWGPPLREPSAVQARRVRYYRDPLDRLVRLHRSFTEMSTGVTYRSPFERSDAQFR